MIWYVVFWTLTMVLLVFVAAAVPLRSRHSAYQRAQAAKKASVPPLDTRREDALVSILSLQRTVGAVLLAANVLLAVAAWGWFIGSVVSLLVGVLYGRIALLGAIQRLSQTLYRRYELALLSFVETRVQLATTIRSPFISLNPVTSISSREELEQSIEKLSKSVVTPDERAALLASLRFSQLKVVDYMMTRKKIPTVDGTTLLGPLVLDDLHKTGHSRFVVVDGSIDTVSGILDITSHLNLHSKESMTAQESMTLPVHYIQQEAPLEEALDLCLQEYASLLLVVDEENRVVGALQLSDIITALRGIAS